MKHFTEFYRHLSIRRRFLLIIFLFLFISITLYVFSLQLAGHWSLSLSWFIVLLTVLLLPLSLLLSQWLVAPLRDLIYQFSLYLTEHDNSLENKVLLSNFEINSVQDEIKPLSQLFYHLVTHSKQQQQDIQQLQKNQHWLEQHLKRLEVLSQVLDESPTSLIDYISEIQQISQVRYSLFAERDTDNRFHTRVVFDSGYLQDNFTCHLSWAEFEIPLWSNKNQGCQFVPGHHFPDSVKQLVDWPINSGCLITLHPIQNEMDGIMLLLHDKTLPLSSTQVLFVNLYLGRLLQYQIYQKQQKKLKNIPQKLSEEEKMAIFASDAESFTVVAPISSIEAPKDIPSTHKNTIALRVLVAEDSIINQAVIQKMLKHLGHNVDVAENGLVVLDKLQKQDYDLILMDCQMPELDGYATTRKIRHLEKQQQSLRMPIIALTAHALDEHRTKSHMAGMDQHLSKPINLWQLFQLLEKWGKYIVDMRARHTQQLTDSVSEQDEDIFQRTTQTHSVIPPEITTTKNHSIQNPPSLNKTTLNNLSILMGKTQLQKIIQQFLDYAQVQYATLQEAYQMQNMDLLQHKAHQFKGEAYQIGAEVLGDLCKSLEKSSHSGNMADIKKYLDCIKIELQHVMTILTTEFLSA